MGSDDLFWKRKRHTVKRKTGVRGVPKQTFLIVCEGKCTEPNYFKSFKVTSAHIQVIGTGYNCTSLIRKTIELKKNKKTKGIIFDQVWSVFDRDSFSVQDFNNAFQLAKENRINVAYSNEAFKLWYLLHFHYFNSAIGRRDYIMKLHNLLGRKYSKNSNTIYEELLDKQTDAIRNSKKLLATYKENYSPESANPSTTVHLLVEELNKYI